MSPLKPRTASTAIGTPAQYFERAKSKPFSQDASFDLVIAMALLCLVPSLNRAISELARVLGSGFRFCSCSAAPISNCTLIEGTSFVLWISLPAQLVTKYPRHA